MTHSIAFAYALSKASMQITEDNYSVTLWQQRMQAKMPCEHPEKLRPMCSWAENIVWIR